MTRALLALLALSVVFACADEPGTPYTLDYAAIEARLPARAATGRISDRLPDIEVTNQHGEKLRFFEDLVRDRALVVNFMYTACPKICPGTTSNLVRLHERLGTSADQEVTFVSVTLDPDVDSPEVLHRYWSAFGSHPRWQYITGSYEEIELLRRRMGVYDLDPVIDADRTQHSGIITLGNDRDNRWVALPALSAVEDLADAVVRFSRRGVRIASPPRPRVETRIYSATGYIESIQAGHDTVVIRHDDIKDLMPAMTMRFELAGSELLDGVREGVAIDFSVVRTDSNYRIVELSTRTGGASVN